MNAYRLTGYQTEERPHLRIFGLQNDREAVLWLQNQYHTWYRMRVGMDLRPVRPVRFSVQGLRDGDYRVEWWDTYSGEPTAYQGACCEGGILQIETPEILRDIACKIELLDEAE